MKQYRNKRAATALAAALLSLLLLLVCMTEAAWRNSGTINAHLNVQTSRIETREGGEDADTAYYKSAYGDTAQGNGNTTATLLTKDNLEKLLADEKAFCIEEQIDGSVLLQNDNGALPLEKGSKVTLLGHAVAQPVYKPASGGGFVDRTRVISLHDALADEGFSINETVFQAYGETNSQRDHGYNVNTFALGEEPASFYTDELKTTFSAYGDAAIIMFAREGGEYRDLARSESASDNGEAGISHLALHRNERDLLALAKEYKDKGVFAKVIVLLNTSAPMEVGELKDYGVDATLWIGGPGTYGFAGVADILSGDGNPSGRLVDTYAANSLSAPATVNFGVHDYTNADDIAAVCADADDFVTHYTVQAENIYVGYKYYETRYADLIMGRGHADSAKGVWCGEDKWDYAVEVVYPFGYGLSYTTFTETLDNLVWDERTVTATVTVQNTGSVAGKKAVELYVSAPYTEGGLEKAAIQLCGFEKTGLIAPGESVTLTVTADAGLFASWDEALHGGEGGYVLEKGAYRFAIGDSVHDALNNILAAQGYTGLYEADGSAAAGNAALTSVVDRAEDDDTTYNIGANGTKIQNRFADMNINNLVEEKVTYLSRADWDATYPTAVPVLTATETMIRELDGNTYEKPEGAADTFRQGEQNGLTLVSMKDVPYDDEETWNAFLDQLSLSDLGKVIYEFSGVERSVDAVGMPAFIANDGPDGLEHGYLDAKVSRDNADYMADRDCPTCYPNEIVAASTWDKAHLMKRGAFMGEDALFAGVAIAWAPGANLHRTPFSGRNFEYFSEDSVLSYEGGAAIVSGMQSKGLIASIKHFVGNDQETQRTGLSTFSTEQAFRENDLRGFEGAFVKGGALGTMTSFNRLGCTATPHSDALQNGVLRGEWGFTGYIITDACGSRSYIHSIESIANGTDMFCMSYESRAQEILNAIGKGDGNLHRALRDANKHIYFALSRSNLINGMHTDTVIIPITPWWKTALIALDSVMGAATLIALGYLCWILWQDRKERRA